MAGPLKGIKILDFSHALPGPFATMLLGDMGAEVLKVEAPFRPDLMRMSVPMDGSDSAAHLAINRNKRSLTLDMKNPAAADVVKQLVKSYDVLLEQFRPGVMAKLGVGYEVLAKENPRLIYCSITGYGQTGPYKNRAGHDINYLATSSIPSFSGRAAEGPAPQSVQIADIGSGSYNAVVGILAAIINREKSGEGQYIDISMTDGCVTWLVHHAPHWFVDSRNPAREKEFLNGGMHFYNYYETKDGQYMSVGSIEPPFYRQLCEGIGRPDLVDYQMAGGDDLERIKKEIAVIFKSKTRAEWTGIFSKLDACVEPVLHFSEMTEHPHIKARGMVVEVPKPDGSKVKQVASPIKFSKSSLEYKFVGTQLGENTEQVLKEAGYSGQEIAELKAKKVFG